MGRNKAVDTWLRLCAMFIMKDELFDGSRSIAAVPFRPRRAGKAARSRGRSASVELEKGLDKVTKDAQTRRDDRLARDIGPIGPSLNSSRTNGPRGRRMGEKKKRQDPHQIKTSCSPRRAPEASSSTTSARRRRVSRKRAPAAARREGNPQLRGDEENNVEPDAKARRVAWVDDLVVEHEQAIKTALRAAVKGTLQVQRFRNFLSCARDKVIRGAESVGLGSSTLTSASAFTTSATSSEDRATTPPCGSSDVASDDAAAAYAAQLVAAFEEQLHAGAPLIAEELRKRTEQGKNAVLDRAVKVVLTQAFAAAADPFGACGRGPAGRGSGEVEVLDTEVIRALAFYQLRMSPQMLSQEQKTWCRQWLQSTCWRVWHGAKSIAGRSWRITEKTKATEIK